MVQGRSMRIAIAEDAVALAIRPWIALPAFVDCFWSIAKDGVQMRPSMAALFE
jgi:hypothetical protein